jgi:two-component system cell cycle response regulator CtrA
MRVLLVEDQVPQAQAMNAFFKAEGLVVEHTSTSDDAMGLLRHYQFDIIVLSRHVADTDCTPLISRVRSAGHHTPVLALLKAASTKERLAALSAGADDVVELDADRAELLARMRSIMRRSRGYSQPIIRCGRVALNQENQVVTVDDKHLHLTHREFALLQLLMMRKNMVMTKEAILSNLYGGMDEPEIKIIDVFVCKIRSKLAKAGLRNVIQTVWGRGYVVRDASRDDDTTPEPRIPQPLEMSRRELAVV